MNMKISFVIGGKTTLAKKYFVAHGYEHINRVSLLWDISSSTLSTSKFYVTWFNLAHAIVLQQIPEFLAGYLNNMAKMCCIMPGCFE